MKKNNLKYLIGNLDVSEFLKSYYGKDFLYIKRENSQYYNDIFSIVDFDDLISKNIHSAKYLKMFKVNNTIDEKNYSFFDNFNREKQISINDVLEYFQDGFSIVLDDIARNFRNFLDIEIDLAQKLSFVENISSNAYLTPGDSQAFPLHNDIQEAFIVQLYGSKTWEIYPGSQSSNPIDFSQDHLLQDLKEKDGLKLELNQGDLLYLPRGLAHKVYAEKNSLHVTISVVPYTYNDILKNMISTLVNSNPDFRKTIKDNSVDIKKHMIDAIDSFNLNETLDVLRNKNNYNKLLNHETTIISILDPELNEDNRFSMRENMTINVLNGQTTFIYGAKEVEIEGDFQFLSSMESFKVSDLFNFIDKDIASELLIYLSSEGFIKRI
ncbi:JmjC domain-containing protein [Winogradskyella eximia]|uniref:JmjC domain-containing protein n=1 Tax=Winogradskyella eximia TaxID=262006 RepID=UPI0024921AD7|nr:cupin domain-containing protein [Winogradskyella eximia]